MQIISLNNHIVRKALCLSLNEMAVLCDIKQMSQNPEYGYTCIKSKEKIADWLDLSRTTVFTIIDTLIKKGLIEKNEIGLKPSELVYKLDMCQEDIGLWLKNGTIELVTKKIQDILNPCTDSTDSVLPQYSFCTQVYNIDNKEKLNKKKDDNVHIKHEKSYLGKSNEGIDFMGLREAVELWLKYKAEKKQNYKSSSSVEIMIKKLHKFSGGDSEIAMQIIEESIANNYQGFFELKNVKPKPVSATPEEAGDAKMWDLINKGFKNLSPEQLRWVFEWQHRTSYSYNKYPDNIRLVKPTSTATKQDCIDADRAAGFN
jgi:hypothetical protein